MIPKRCRINSKYYFNKVKYYAQSHRTSFYTDSFIVNVMPAKDPNASTSVGVVVSSKVSKLAVVRNKARRRLFSLCRDYVYSDPKLAKGLFLVFYPKRHIIDISYEKLKFDFDKAIQKISDAPTL